jgi:hypothetical protein
MFISLFSNLMSCFLNMFPSNFVVIVVVLSFNFFLCSFLLYVENVEKRCHL